MALPTGNLAIRFRVADEGLVYTALGNPPSTVVTTDGATVRQWNPTVEGTYAFQALSADKSPTLALGAVNGKNALYFGGANRMAFASDASELGVAISAIVGSGSYTLVTVAKTDGAPAGTQQLFGDSAVYWAQQLHPSGYRFKQFLGFDNDTPYVTFDVAEPHVFFAWAENTVNCGAQVDDGTPVTGTSSFGNANINGNNGTSIGGRTSDAEFFTGWVCEVLVYSKILTVQERADAYEALAADWIISAAPGGGGASAAPKFGIASPPNRGIINGRRPCWA